MMNPLEILSIVFASTAANHLGLVAAVEGVTGLRLPVLNCPKCLTFWSVLAYGCSVCCNRIAVIPAALPRLLAVSFLCAWLAIWLDLAMGFIDRLYLYAYGKIYPTTDTTNTDAPPPTDPLPGLPE